MSNCILWHKSKDKDGYGQIFVNGKRRLAHRLKYCEAHNCTYDSIRGFIIRHTCDTPSCVNPDHLVIGTHADNMQDRADRQRTAVGTAHGNVKLSEADVLTIRARYVKGDRNNSLSTIAKDYGITFQTVSKIINRQKWQHI